MSDASETGSGPYTNVTYLTQVTDTNRAGVLWITGLLSLLYPLITCFVRLSVRVPSFGTDDWVLVGSTVVSVAQHAAIFFALADGLGMTTGLAALSGKGNKADSAILAAKILYILVQGGAKVSLALFIRRLFNNSARFNTFLCNGLFAATVFWTVSSLVILFAGCHFSIFSTSGGRCPTEPIRWWIVTALDMATEALLVAIPTLLVSRVMIAFQAKALVCSAFASRLPLIIFSAIHAVKVAKAQGASDLAFAYVDVVLWTQIIIAWSLISASIPSFKAFMHPFDAINADEHFGSGLRSQVNGAYLMMGRENPKEPSQMRSGRSADPSAVGRLRMDKVDQQAAVAAGKRQSSADQSSVASLHSQTDIIRRDVRWDISYDSPKST